MKKIMCALAAVAFAMGVNAASVDWKVQEAGKGAALVGQQVMAFDSADYTAVISLLTTTGSADMDTALAGYRLGNTQSIINNRGTALVTSVQVENAPDSMFWVIFSDKSTVAGSAISWTAATDVSGAMYEAGNSSPGAFTLTSANFANSGSIAAVSGGGGSGDIPEPTSGILLVVGGALLALRRKQK